MRVGDAPINQTDVPIITQSMGTTRILYPAPGALSPDRPAPVRKDSPDHGATSFGAVFVNDLGRAAMFSKTSSKFPVGSMIVREKLSSLPLVTGNQPSSSPTPPPLFAVASLPAQVRLEELGPPLILVVMLKRERGFNPKANDWEFLTVTGDGKKIEKRETAGACLKCHKSQATSDFVFRNSGL